MPGETLKYKIATESDLAAMASVMARANALRDGQPLPEIVENDGAVDDLRDRMHKDGAWTHVAVERSRIAGFILGYPYSQGDDAPVDPAKEYVSLLMVDPDYWGKGIASKLLAIAADRARQLDNEQLLLWTRAEDNERARDVYEHKGYVATGLTRFSRHGFGLQVQYALDL